MTRNRWWSAWHGVCLLVVVGGIAPTLARAHFILTTPDSWMSQDVLGGPQKLGPCGDEGGGTPTGKVTAFRPGDTISVTIDEVIYHPGHYRVALAINDRSELPDPPQVTPSDNDPCASAAIQYPPRFPILADNVLPHRQPFTGPQTFTVTLPSDITCSKCTLQILEFMSTHGQPCFYHHCADISVQDGSVPTTTLPTGAPGTTTTTTLPCATPRCALEAAVYGAACASDTIPEAIQRKLDRGPELLDLAAASAGGKTKVLRKKAKRSLKQAGAQALRASRGKKPKLSVGCAAAIKETVDRLVSGL